MLKSYRFWFGLIVSVICLVLSFQGIRFDLLWEAIRQVNLWWVLPAYFFFIISFVGRVFRWQLLYAPIHVRWGEVLSKLSIGYFLSSVLPARLGDFVRAYLLGVSEKVPFARSISTLVIERIADGLSIVLFLVLLLPFIPNIPNEARSGALAAALVGLAALVVLFVMSWQRERGVPLLKRIVSPFPLLRRESLWHSLEALIDGLSILHDPKALFGVAAWCLWIWFFNAVLNWIGMISMGLSLGLDAAILVMVVTSLVVIVPSSPGYIGVFHYATQLTLTQVYRVDPTSALAYAVVIHAFVYLNLILFGFLFMSREGLHLSELQAIQAPTN